MKLLVYNGGKKVINRGYRLCEMCDKNAVTCLEGEEVCLPLEMLNQLCAEKSTGGKLEMIDNVIEYFEEGN